MIDDDDENNSWPHMPTCETCSSLKVVNLKIKLFYILMVLKDKNFDIIQYCTYILSISDVQNFFGCLFFACPLQLPRNSLKFLFWFVTLVFRPRWRRWPWDSGIVYSSMDMCTYNIGNASASVLFPDLEKRDQHSSISCPLLPLPFCPPPAPTNPFPPEQQARVRQTRA